MVGSPETIFTSSVPKEDISDFLLSQFASLIYDRTGIHLSPQKKTLLSNRLRRRLRETKIPDYETYFNHIKKLPSDHVEWDAFLQEITTHETYLFRDEVQWTWFQKEYIPGIVKEAEAGTRGKSLRIWSAACSTGDEAFTIASCLAGCIPDVEAWKIRIVGTDIGVGAVEQAQSAVFGERSMKQVPKHYKTEFFTELSGTKTWQAKPILTKMTNFRQHNLLNPLREQAFDIVFLKNVLIYFDGPSKALVMQHVKPLIAEGGYLIAGGAEGIFEFIKDLERTQPWLNRKPSGK